MGARFVDCPRCGAKVAWRPENRYRPFCSERCKLVDLGDWAMERYRVPLEEDPDSPEADQPE
jgi:uncharacterized protein